MKPKVNLLALALESSLLLKKSYVLIVPFMIATLLSFVAYFVMFAGLDPELINDLNVFFDSPEVQKIVLIGAACYSVLNVLAMGAASAMSLELIKRGRTSLGTAKLFLLSNGSRMFMLSVLMGLAVIVGMRLAIFPGLLAAFFLMFAPAVFVLESPDPLEAIRKSFMVVTANAGDCGWLFFSFSLAYFVMNLALMALIFIPVIGILAAFFMTCGYMAALTIVMLRVYIALMPPAPSAPDVS